jgi:hypothetical protein
MSFGFQFGQRAAAASSPSLARVLRFAGLQLLVPTPLLAGVLLAAAFAALRRLREPAFGIGAVFSVPVFLLFAAVSPFTWVKGNWPAPAWPGAIVAAAAFYLEAPGRFRALARWSLGTAAALTLYLHLAAVVPYLPFAARDDTTRGWRALAARVQSERERIGPAAFVVGCYYKLAALLAYYLPDRPRTFSSEALGGNGLQFRVWSEPGALDGREGVVVVDTRDGDGWCPERERRCRPLEELAPFEVERQGMWTLGGLLSPRVAVFRLWRCRYTAAAP